jgi:hypothetical protein
MKNCISILFTAAALFSLMSPESSAQLAPNAPANKPIQADSDKASRIDKAILSQRQD